MKPKYIPAAALALLLFFCIACVQEKKEADWLQLRQKTIEENETGKTKAAIEENSAKEDNQNNLQEISGQEITLKGFVSTDAAFPSTLFHEGELIQFFSSIEGSLNSIKIPLIVTEFIPCDKAKVKGFAVKRNAVDLYTKKLSAFSLIKVNSFECIE